MFASYGVRSSPPANQYSTCPRVARNNAFNVDSLTRAQIKGCRLVILNQNSEKCSLDSSWHSTDMKSRYIKDPESTKKKTL